MVSSEADEKSPSTDNFADISEWATWMGLGFGWKTLQTLMLWSEIVSPTILSCTMFWLFLVMTTSNIYAHSSGWMMPHVVWNGIYTTMWGICSHHGQWAYPGESWCHQTWWSLQMAMNDPVKACKFLRKHRGGEFVLLRWGWPIHNTHMQFNTSSDDFEETVMVALWRMATQPWPLLSLHGTLSACILIMSKTLQRIHL